MNINNLERAGQIKQEIDNIDKQIESALKLVDNCVNKDGGFLIAEHADLSGTSIGYIYKAGNFPKELYGRMAESILEHLYIYKHSLVQEAELL